MRILFVNGTKLDLTWHEVQRMFWHPSFVALVLVISAIIILLRPYGDLVQFNAMSLTLFYANGIVTFMALLVALVYALYRLGKTIITAVIISFAVTLATLWGLAFGVLLGADVPRAMDFVLVAGFNLTFVLLGELVLSTFLLRRILKDILAPAARTQFASFMTDTAGGLHILARPPTCSRGGLAGAAVRCQSDHVPSGRGTLCPDHPEGCSNPVVARQDFRCGGGLIRSGWQTHSSQSLDCG